MRIDCEMHTGEFKGDPYVWLGHPVGPKELEAVLDTYKLDMTIVMAPTAEYPDNESVAHAIHGNRRFLGFAVVNPYGPGGGVEELDRAVKAISSASARSCWSPPSAQRYSNVTFRPST
jgi:hypothetical protein